ncbi:MAG: hypothetical protein ACFB4I_03120 [Cyanophyceae cyanobacterium]
MLATPLGKYLTLKDYCTCTSTYQKHANLINPHPQNPETISALKNLNQNLVEPIMDGFGADNFRLTYGFCSLDLKRFLEQKDVTTGSKNGRADPSRDQHMAHEVKRTGQYYCPRQGAACDFLVVGLTSDRVVDWILARKLPFDSLYFYGSDRPIHISYGPQHKRAIWTFTAKGQPTKKGIENWLGAAQY